MKIIIVLDGCEINNIFKKKVQYLDGMKSLDLMRYLKFRSILFTITTH